MTSNSYTTAAQEDRCGPRTGLRLQASLRPQGSRGFLTVVHDISTSGFSAEAVNRLPRGTFCWLTLEDLGALRCEVVRWRDGKVGCAFAQLFDPAVLDAHLARWGRARSVS